MSKKLSEYSIADSLEGLYLAGVQGGANVRVPPGLSSWVSASIYGADTDATRGDNTEAIQDALDSGNDAILLVGDYRVDGTLEVPSGVRVQLAGSLKRLSAYSDSTDPILAVRGSNSEFRGGTIQTENASPDGIVLLGHAAADASYNSMFWGFHDATVIGVQSAGNIGVRVLSSQPYASGVTNYFGDSSNIVVRNVDVGCQVEEEANAHTFTNYRFWNCITAGFQFFGAYANKVMGGFLHTSTNGVAGVRLMDRREVGGHDSTMNFIFGFGVEPGGAASLGVYIDENCTSNSVLLASNALGGNTRLNDNNLVWNQLGGHRFPLNRIVYMGDIDVSGDVVKMTGLPTSNPNVAGQIWNDGGTLKISAG